jgi:hypothetical protein
VVGNKIILDSKHIDKDNGRLFQGQAQLIQGFTQQRIELLANIVDACDASMLIETTVVVPRHSKLLRHATKRTRAMYPELPGPILMQPLQFHKDLIIILRINSA